MERTILHCDMNNFYASVECFLNPKLKPYPVAVCGSAEERHGIVLAKNYKAKAFGVSTGEAIWQAKQKCKDLVVVPPHYEEYMKFSKAAREIYEDYTDQVEAFGEKCLDACGSRKFFCSDELYIRAERQLPEEDFYEGYVQIENGVGMLRSLITEFESGLKLEDEAGEEATPFTVATGVSARPFLRKLADDLEAKLGVKGQVIAIQNDFFGHTIDVAGLITGQDLIAQLKGRELGRRLLIPVNMLRHGEDVFLDDVTVADVERELNVKVCPVNQDGFDLCDLIFEEGGA